MEGLTNDVDKSNEMVFYLSLYLFISLIFRGEAWDCHNYEHCTAF